MPILKRSRIVLRALLGASLFCAIPLGSASAGRVGVEPASAASYSQRLTLGVGRAIIVDLPGEASEIIVGDPKVANAVVRSARKIYVMGVSTGQTTIIALDKAGAQIANVDLNVGRDLGELSKLLKTALPKSDIRVQQINYTLILSGEVDSAGDATLALDLARAFVNASTGGAGAAVTPAGGASGPQGGEGSVVSTITIRGRDQVMVKVTIAEVQRNILKQLGVSTSASTPDTLLKTSWATFTQQNPFTLNGNLSTGGLNVPLSSTTSLNLQAFERYGVSRVLAEPTVTAVSGETAKFTAGGEIPVPQNSTCTPTLVPGTQPSCTVGIAFKPYGVTLNMTPVVLSAGRILLRVASEVTEIDPTQTVTIASVAVPGFRTRKNETSVELPSGGSLATAGLITNNSRQAINGLPGMINLPILGALFRSRDYMRQETELLIVVTPYLARPTAPNAVTRPDDGFSEASDPQAWLLGRVNRLYSTRSNPEAVQNLRGRFGFIQD